MDGATNVTTNNYEYKLMAFKILLHTFRMVFGNFGQALKVSIGPVLILLCVVLVHQIYTTGAFSDRPLRDETGWLIVTPVAHFLALIVALVWLVATLWIAASWHRVILLNTRNQFLSQLTQRPVWKYVGKAMLAVLMVGFIMMLLRWVFGYSSYLEPQYSILAGGLYRMYAVIYYGLLVVLVTSFLRLGVCLVAESVEQSIGIREAWQRTSKVSGALLIIGALFVVFYAFQPYLELRFFVFIRSYLTDQQMLVAAFAIEDRPLVS